jgi:hypothetical protein
LRASVGPRPHRIKSAAAGSRTRVVNDALPCGAACPVPAPGQASSPPTAAVLQATANG